jgi:hypothetical protein
MELIPGKFYVIDLTSIGREQKKLFTVTKDNTYRVLASTESLVYYGAGLVEDSRLFRFDSSSKATPSNEYGVYGNHLISAKPNDELYIDRSSMSAYLKKCSIQEVPKENLILWIGSTYQSTALDNLLKGCPP